MTAVFGDHTRAKKWWYYRTVFQKSLDITICVSQSHSRGNKTEQPILRTEFPPSSAFCVLESEFLFSRYLLNKIGMRTVFSIRTATNRQSGQVIKQLQEVSPVLFLHRVVFPVFFLAARTNKARKTSGITIRLKLQPEFGKYL